MKNKEIYKKHWSRIKGHNKNNRTHHSEVKNITNQFEFDTFIDCGVGYAGSESWSVNDLKPECKIFGFEPQNERHEYLVENNFPGNLLKMGVGEQTGQLEGLMGYEGGKSDFWANGSEDLIDNGEYKKEVINITTIDDIINEYNLDKVFIWADIEGSELNMLKGCVESLKSNKIVGFNLELRSIRASQGHCTAQEVFTYLNEFGFKNMSGTPSPSPKDFLFKKI